MFSFFFIYLHRTGLFPDGSSPIVTHRRQIKFISHLCSIRANDFIIEYCTTQTETLNAVIWNIAKWKYIIYIYVSFLSHSFTFRSLAHRKQRVDNGSGVDKMRGAARMLCLYVVCTFADNSCVVRCSTATTTSATVWCCHIHYTHTHTRTNETNTYGTPRWPLNKRRDAHMFVRELLSWIYWIVDAKMRRDETTAATIRVECVRSKRNEFSVSAYRCNSHGREHWCVFHGFCAITSLC